jgi:L-aminopeptidase/D-esterase-like protein
LKRLAKRAALGLARTGGSAGNGSGDIFLAFSTANPGTAQRGGVAQIQMLRNDAMNGILSATLLATEEAIINCLVAAETMTGVDGHTAVALPHDRLKAVLRKYNRWTEPTGKAERAKGREP